MNCLHVVDRGERIKEDLIRDSKLFAQCLEDIRGVLNDDNLLVVVAGESIDAPILMPTVEIKQVDLMLSGLLEGASQVRVPFLLRLFLTDLSGCLKDLTESHEDEVDDVEAGLESEGRVSPQGALIVLLLEHAIETVTRARNARGNVVVGGRITLLLWFFLLQILLSRTLFLDVERDTK